MKKIIVLFLIIGSLLLVIGCSEDPGKCDGLFISPTSQSK